MTSEMQLQILPYVLVTILGPIAIFTLKWLISDWFRKARQLAEYKDKATQDGISKISKQVEKLTGRMDSLSGKLEQYGTILREATEKIRKNVEDNRNLSRNIKDEVRDIMKTELPGLIREFKGGINGN